MKRNLIRAALTAVMTVSAISGCVPAKVSNKENTMDSKGVLADSRGESGSDTRKAVDGKETLVFWTGLSGRVGEVIQQVIDNYNNSQDKVFVDPQYQGLYQGSLNKLKTFMHTQDGPDLIQIYEAGTRAMISSGPTIPMQQITDGYNIDISELKENVLNYYTIDDQPYSMPLNTSVPVCYHNETVLPEIGYEDGPQSWDDIADISRKVMDQGLSKLGIALCSNPIWCFEQPMIQQKYPVTDNGNGRTGRTTETAFTSGMLAVEIASKFQELATKGYAVDVGFTIEADRAAFWSGNAVIMCDSPGSIRSSLETIGGAYGPGICKLPGLITDAPNSGVALGSDSAYIRDNGKGDSRNEGIADFVKYLVSPKIRGYILANARYFSVTGEALNQDAVKETLKTYLQCQAVADMMDELPNMGYGSSYASPADARGIYSSYLERMILGEITPKEYISKSAEKIDILIEEYNGTSFQYKNVGRVRPMP